MKCKRCGFENKGKNKFCAACGKRLKAPLILKLMGILAVLTVVAGSLFFSITILEAMWEDGDEGSAQTSQRDEELQEAEESPWDLGSLWNDAQAGEVDDYGIDGTDLELSDLRPHFVQEESAESAVVMVYMIGSDLESMDGSASDDIEEMLEADLGENLQIVLQTGGAKWWYLDEISSEKQERWLIDQEGPSYVGSAGSGSMTRKSALTDFISFAAGQYPADRYFLILWDHGGGTMGGYGYDELYEDESLSLADLSEAVQKSGVKFSMIGFDACLMATVETAFCLEPCADYLIASEEYMPGDGWYYTDFLTRLGQDPGIPSLELGKEIIDDYGYYYDNDEVTLSMIELREIPYVYERLGDFLQNARADVQEDNARFRELSVARSKAREYCDASIDQVDMYDLVRRADFEGKEELLAAIESCVKYRNDSSLTGSYGLAMYFPYSAMEAYGDTSRILDSIGFSEPLEVYNYFLSVMAGGQSRNETGNGLATIRERDYEEENWYRDYQAEFDYGEEYGDLYLEETEEGFELILDEEVWDLITDIQLVVMVYDGEDYLNLGYDNLVSWSEDGNLLLDFGYYWVSIDGQPVPFFADTAYEEEGAMIYSGRVYATLNGDTEIELYLEWKPVTEEMAQQDEFEAEGFIKGYRVVNENTLTVAKGFLPLQEGDELEFFCDCYDEDGDYSGSYVIAQTTVGAKDPEVSYEELEDMEVICWYALTDIYQQELYTETIVITP